MKNNITAWVLILFFFFAVPLCHGAMTLADADSAYSRGDYQAAVDAYVDVMESQGYSAPLLFNLGNAAFKAGDWGLARLSYERARRLDPSSEAINNNLDYLASKIEDANKAEQRAAKASSKKPKRNDNREEETVAAPAIEKTTLGDLGALQALKEQMQKEGK